MRLEDLTLVTSVQPREGDALIVVDMQYDFMPGGALPVDEGDTIIAGVNRIMEQFSTARLPIVQTQDWHPRGHHSFASAHPGKQPYDPYEAAGIGPVLWPDHCKRNIINYEQEGLNYLL